MATASFFAPYDMAAAQTWFGTVVLQNSTDIVLGDGFNAGHYLGSFSYAGDDVFGTWTGYQGFAGGTLTTDVSGLSVVDVAQAQSATTNCRLFSNRACG